MSVLTSLMILDSRPDVVDDALMSVLTVLMTFDERLDVQRVDVVDEF